MKINFIEGFYLNFKISTASGGWPMGTRPKENTHQPSHTRTLRFDFTEITIFCYNNVLKNDIFILISQI